jgi:hypothetical protein
MSSHSALDGTSSPSHRMGIGGQCLGYVSRVAEVDRREEGRGRAGLHHRHLDRGVAGREVHGGARVARADRLARVHD